NSDNKPSSARHLCRTIKNKTITPPNYKEYDRMVSGKVKAKKLQACNGSVTEAKEPRAGSVLTFFRPQPRKKCRTDPDAPPSLTGYVGGDAPIEVGEGVPFHAIRVDDGFGSIEPTRFCKGIRLGRRFWACVDLARVVSAFVVCANRPVRLIGLCKAAPRPFRNI